MFKASPAARGSALLWLGLGLTACDATVVTSLDSGVGDASSGHDAQARRDAGDASKPDSGGKRDASSGRDAGDASRGRDAGDASRGDSGGAMEGGVPTFALVQSVVFSGCSGPPGPMMCHARAPFADGLDLVDDNAYGLLVRAPALEATGQVLVVPGDADASFLMKKLLDDLPDDGSQGDPMPKGEAIRWMQLPDDQIQLVRDWINGGALGP